MGSQGKNEWGSPIKGQVK